MKIKPFSDSLAISVFTMLSTQIYIFLFKNKYTKWTKLEQMDWIGPKMTKVDQNKTNEPQWTEINQIGLKQTQWTKVDRNGPNWTEQTEMDQIRLK